MMDIVVKEEEGCKRVLEIKAPSSLIENEIVRLLNNYKTRMSVPGFRKGKVPLDMVKKKLGDTLQKEALENIIPKIYKEAIQKKNFIPVTQASIEKINYEPPDFGFQASFEVLPAPEVENYKDIPVEKRRIKIGTKEVEDRLSKLRELNAVYNGVKREAQEGDYIIFDYEQIGGEMGKPSQQASNYALTLKQGEKYFEDLLGAKAGDVREVGDTDGESYRVTIKEIKERELPLLDDEFAKDLGVNDLKELEEKIKIDLKKEEDEKIKMEMERKVIEEIIQRNPFDVPESFLEGAKDRDLAIYQTKRIILLNQIADKEEITVNDEELLEATDGSNASEEEKKEIRSHLRKKKTVDFLLNQVQIKKEKDSKLKRWFRK
jgi:trigger factor